MRSARGGLIFLLVLLAGALLLCYRIAQPFFGPLIGATVMAVALAPLHRKMLRWLRGNRTLAALITSLSGVLLIVIPVSVLGISLTYEVQEIYSTLEKRSVEGGGWGPFFTQLVERPIDAVSSVVPVSPEALRAEIVQRVGEASRWLLGMTRSALGRVAETLFNVLFSVILLYFFVRDGDRLLRYVAGFLPLTPRQITRLGDAAGRTIVANVHGVLVVAVVQGTLLFIGLLVIGVRPATTWALMGAFCSMIPVLGTAIVWATLSLALLLQGFFWKALILALWGGLVVSTSDNIVRPLVVGSQTRQHPLLVFLAILGGLRAFGLVGLLVGPIVVAITLAVLDLLKEEVRAGIDTPERAPEIASATPPPAAGSAGDTPAEEGGAASDFSPAARPRS